MDVIDRCLMDIMSVYRDVVAVQVRAPGALVNEEMRPEVEDLARRSTRRTTCVASTRSSRPASR